MSHMRRRIWQRTAGTAALTALALGCMPQGEIVEESFHEHRGTGSPTSMFGTYCRRGEFLVYPFYEYYKNDDEEYSPNEFDPAWPDVDYRGKNRAKETLIFLGYGLTDDVNVEFEAALHIEETLWKDPTDASPMPAQITESGLGDVQAEINWRWKRETADTPAWFSFLEIVFPVQDDEILIGTTAWEFKFGTGSMKGYPWGSIAWRVAVEYDGEEPSGDRIGFGEYAFDYLKRLSPAWRLYLGIEGSDDEIELIPEMQWHLSERAFVKLNSAFGLTSKAQDWAPEVGIMFSF